MGLKEGQLFEVKHLLYPEVNGKKKRREIPIGKLKLERFEGDFIRFDIYEDEEGLVDYFNNRKEDLLIRELDTGNKVERIFESINPFRKKGKRKKKDKGKG